MGRHFIRCVCLALLLLTPAALFAEGRPYVRILRDDAGKPLSLDAAIVTMKPGSGENSHDVHVDLVSALHIGEAEYYDGLESRFRDYDAVLFELIAAPGTDFSQKPKHGVAANPVSTLQQTMKRMLDLEFQLEAIDYGAKNFVHADMSPSQFARSMRERNETFGGLFVRAFLAAIKKQSANRGKAPDVQSLFLLLLDNGRSLALRRILAEELEDMDGLIEGLGGERGSTILTERNRVAIETLKREMANGKKKFAIFYGGAHMPDIEDQLRRELGLEVANEEWVVAWHLAGTRPAKAAREG